MNYVRIPFWGRISATLSLGMTINGVPSSITVAKDTLDPREKYYSLTIRGNSMERTFKDGEMILVERTRKIKRGDVVIVRTQEGDTIKSIHKNTPKTITLISDTEEKMSFLT